MPNAAWHVPAAAAGLALLGAALLVGGCEAAPPAVSATEPTPHWIRPLEFQGQAPDSWSDAERSLSPLACAECHENTYKDWRTSLHSSSFTAGAVGETLSFTPQWTLRCMRCHAPLAEQFRDFMAARKEGSGHLREEQGLAASGNSCGGCHVRKWRVFGPPGRDTGALGATPSDFPHGGVTRVEWFEDAAFCAACHQFSMKWAVNGKPMLNTYNEWLASPQAKEGITCQDCHMPGRKHLWRGIHDPEMTASGLTAKFSATEREARFDLTNSGVGHAFPTYITPKVVMYAVSIDERGRALTETVASHTIHRTTRRNRGEWEELKDTRLLPGETATLKLRWRLSNRIRMWVEVDPDDDYSNNFFEEVLLMLPAGSPEAARIHEAIAWGKGNRYRLFETVIERP